MIYSTDECIVINGIRNRKILEKSIYNSMDSLPIAFRSAMDAQLDSDIARCEAMIRIGMNDLSNLYNDMEALSPQPSCLSLELYQHYLNSLTEEDMKLESSFVFYSNLGIDFYIHMAAAKNIANAMLDGGAKVSYAEFIKTQKIRDMLNKSKARCDDLKDDTDLPYAAAGRYIDCMLNECSLILKMYLSKDISVKELCRHIDQRTYVSSDDYNKLFLTEFSPEDRGDMVSFQNNMKDRSDLMLAQLIVQNELHV